MRGVLRLCLKRLFDHLKDGLRLDAGLSPSPSALLLDPLEALFPDAVPPAHRHFANQQFSMLKQILRMANP